MRRFIINVNGNSYNVDVEEVGAPAPQAAPVAAPAAAPAAPPAPAPQAAPPAPAPTAAPADGIKVTAPMPGNILDIQVTEGQQVAEGEILVILEAVSYKHLDVYKRQRKASAAINVFYRYGFIILLILIISGFTG